MASAIELIATNTIINGHGLAISTDLVEQIATFQAQAPIVSVSSAFNTANSASSNIKSNLLPVITTLGTGVTKGQWLLDMYPSNVSPVCSGTVVYYSQTHNPVFSKTVLAQASLPFSNGMSAFANVFSTSFAFINSSFDTVSSVHLLTDKTYAQSGIGYTTTADLVTYGIGTNAQVFIDAISNWGTMFDINNINSLGDPYVFGQNLLNQGLGSYGSLSDQLRAAGLNTKNLSAVPQNFTISALQAVTVPVSTPVGQVHLPTLGTVTDTVSVLGNSADVVMNIYSTVTDGDLDAIVTATQITTPKSSVITSLEDYLDLSKVVDAGTYNKLVDLGINNLTTFGNYLHARIGNGSFASWSALASFLAKLEVPTWSTTATADSQAKVLPSTIATSLLASHGTGTGPFNNPTLVDCLGAVAGIPYTEQFKILNANYSVVAAHIDLNALAIDLEIAVSDYVTAVTAYVNGTYPSLSGVTAAVNAINDALNSLPAGVDVSGSSDAFYTMLTQLALEVSNLTKAGASFTAAPAIVLQSFGQRIGSIASDKTQFHTYQFFANMITNDAYGDTIKSAIAENINSGILTAYGFGTTNDPAPLSAIFNAQVQNIPLTTYISQNK